MSGTCFHCQGLLSKGGPTRTVDSHGPKQIHTRCFDEWFAECYPVQCPQCHGAGRIATHFEKKTECCNGGEPKFGGFSAFAGCEYCPNIRRYDVPTSWKGCDLCNSAGRLKEKPEPITETKIVGWKKK